MIDMGGFAEAGVPVLADPSTRRWDTFMDMWAAGGTKFSVSKDGSIAVGAGSLSLPSVRLPGTGTPGMCSVVTGALSLCVGGIEACRINGSANFGIGTGTFRFGADVGATDIGLVREAAGTLAQRATTTAQTWRLYNTYTDASNYERGFARWASNVLEIGAEAAGTGTARDLRLMGVGVGIGTAAPDAKSCLDLSSTTKGFLPPRMTTTQRDAISSPPEGLVIYNTTLRKLNVFTSAWEIVTSV